MLIELVPFGTKKLIDAFSVKAKKRFGFRIKPHFINWIITYRCNSRCRMCNIWQKYKRNPQAVKKELTLGEIKKFLLRNQEFLSEVEHIGLTGGEPFLREDIVEIIKSIKEVLPQAATGPQTNGFLPALFKKKLAQVVKFYPQVSMAVSLDGLEKTHDKIREVEGAFKKAMMTIKYARDLGVKRITCGMTLSDFNYKEIIPVKSLVESLGCEFSCFLPDESEYFGNVGRSAPISAGAKKVIIQTLKDNFGYHYYMDNLRRRMEGKTKRTLPCYSGYYSITIDPYGNVLPCILKKESFGNIKEASLEEILYSPKAKKLKDALKGCVCWSQCEVSTSVLADVTDLVRWFPSCTDKKKFFARAEEIKTDTNEI